MTDPGPPSAVSTGALERARRAAAALAESLDLEGRLAPFAAQRWDGSPPGGPVLHLDDVTGIPFLADIPGVQEYQHRARLRAGDGDLFAAVTEPAQGYEEYCRERLGLGGAELLLASPVEGPMAVARACTAGEAWRHLTGCARRRGGLAIHPYMGIEEVWELAARVADETGAAVKVLAPPPPVTWIANDKGAFSEVVGRVLGRDWLVETLTARDVPTLARHLTELAGRHRRVGLKRLRCASAMGNAVFAAEHLRRLETAAVAAEVRAFLARTEWDGEEGVQAVAWEETELSPSTQLWIPPLGAGPPRLDGLYEQILEGEEKYFIGCRPSALPAPIHRAMAAASLRLAAALQALGYAGRCSFDLLVVGDPAADFRLRFTECNGRWGGTSTPMALLDRLLGGAPRPPHRVQDFHREALVGTTFPELLAGLGGELFDPATGRGRYVLFNVGPLRRHGKVAVIALGRTQEEADEAMEVGLPRALGL